MTRLVALLLALLLPTAVVAATVAGGDSVDVSISPTDNAYLGGAEVRVTAPLPADLVAAAGTLLVTAPVAGDALLAGGTIDVTAPVAGDLRASGGRIVIEGDVGGDIVAAGGALTIAGTAREIRAAGGTVELIGGAGGPVSVYAGNVHLRGEFAGDVYVVASDRVTLAEGTVIRGTLEYNASQEASIPASASIEGGTRYTGSLSFLPSEEEAKTYALAGLGVFFVVKLVASALAAGLLAGLFPGFARRLADETLLRSAKRFTLLMLLGFAAMVATPVLIVLLLASFVGGGIAALIGSIYLLVLILSYLYAAVLAGAALMRLAVKRASVSWKSAVLGTLILFLLGLVPVIGFLALLILWAAALGAMLLLFYRFAFGRAELG